MWFTRVATMLALSMVTVAVGWQIYDLTRSAFDLGLVGLAGFLPIALLFLAVGLAIDRYDRRTIARICQLGAAAAVGVLAYATFTQQIAPALIYGAVVVLGTARAFEFPALQATFPNLVPPEAIAKASARWTAANQASVIVGPALGGAIYALQPGLVYALAAALYLIAATLLTFVRVPGPPLKRERPTLATLFAGIAFIRATPVVLGVISLDLFAVLLGGATALLPIYARDILATGPWGLGLLRSAPALGALVMSVWLGRHQIRRHAGRTMFVAVAGFGAATVAFGLSHVFIVSYVALACLGFADVISVVIRASIVALQVPDAMRGRVGAVNSLFIGTSNQLGEFESGLTAAWFGPIPAVVLGGIGAILVALAGYKVFPQLARVDALEPPA